MFLGLTCDELHGPDVLKKLGKMYPTCEPKDVTKEEPVKASIREDAKRAGSMMYDCKRKQKFKKFVPLETVYERGLLNQDPIQLRYHYMSPNPPQETVKRKLSIVCCCYKRNGLQDQEKPSNCGKCPPWEKAVKSDNPLGCFKAEKWSQRLAQQRPVRNICQAPTYGKAYDKAYDNRQFVGRTFLMHKLPGDESQRFEPQVCDAYEPSREEQPRANLPNEVVVPVYFGDCDGASPAKNRRLYKCQRHGSHIHCREVKEVAEPPPPQPRIGGGGGGKVILALNPSPVPRASQCLTMFEGKYGPLWWKTNLSKKQLMHCESKLNPLTVRRSSEPVGTTPQNAYSIGGQKRPLSAGDKKWLDCDPMSSVGKKCEKNICCLVASGPVV